eukprot:TRINITY_DN11195_c0_g4_i2.p4 TRINITY_DN11195_c0_g4~~TRINITY_DN11195_c0_g4_i2.p4  ORF type:complete len:108 (+),score=10.38 TRINITY_DN11195_c0_g4_i2:271-594(+)
MGIMCPVVTALLPLAIEHPRAVTKPMPSINTGAGLYPPKLYSLPECAALNMISSISMMSGTSRAPHMKFHRTASSGGGRCSLSAAVRVPCDAHDCQRCAAARRGTRQ